METVGIIVGMIAAFIAGAWVRKPFALPQQKKRTPAKEAAQKEKDRKAMQIGNLLSYTGNVPEDDDFEN